MELLLIQNPVAGQHEIGAELDNLRLYLDRLGWHTSLVQTTGAGDAARFAEKAVKTGADMVIAVGGDGTLGEVCSGVAGSDCPVGLLPVGTGNVWARQLGIPYWTPLAQNALMDAARMLVDGQLRSVDLGTVHDRRFLLWCGVGFDAQVAAEVEPHRDLRRSFGNITYAVAIAAMSLSMRGERVTLRIDQRVMRQRIIMALVSNAKFYGGSVSVAPQARLDDGLLDVLVFRGNNNLDIIRHVGMVVSGHQELDPKLEVYRAREIVIEGDNPIPIHVDGDPQGSTPVMISVEPRCLSIVTPNNVAPGLFEYAPIMTTKDYASRRQ